MFIAPLGFFRGISCAFITAPARCAAFSKAQYLTRKRTHVCKQLCLLSSECLSEKGLEERPCSLKQEVYGIPGLKRPRIRQHVNPLSQHLKALAEIPAEWPNQIYSSHSSPLHVDIGSASGAFLLRMAEAQPNFNYVGLEIRRSLVEFANARAKSAGVANKAFFLCCNANTAIRRILESYTPGIVRRISLNFPDPYFKRRQQKRRVVQSELVRILGEYLATGSEFICQTDVLEVDSHVREIFDSIGGFVCEELSVSPFPVPSERELSCTRNGRQIYRSLFIRK
ncbi:hypothetical protein F1559_001778 [Cyanidiococcus yangmingshanensis]|uniref:tRNA (guanine(46)-N(7))-methyltransferase n=1 Tax=Cyanidiococcus yangmingshanensis TaxID=2690220 RepID=A0A7J7INU2_9RHOD|nr:hypothetical protein F1559_001778 [Cyanidiococcus yangmingshanensis]